MKKLKIVEDEKLFAHRILLIQLGYIMREYKKTHTPEECEAYLKTLVKIKN